MGTIRESTPVPEALGESVERNVRYALVGDGRTGLRRIILYVTLYVALGVVALSLATGASAVAVVIAIATTTLLALTDA